MSIQPLDVLGGLMFLAGILLITGLIAPGSTSSQRLETGAMLMVLGTAAVAGPRAYRKALDRTG
ncbi:hypothetical protein C5B90_06515 [Haloferax sp. Atlit-12N]|uniref:hypothetical protein n=1 Tax=Haloferax sp. Atlit-12N TaxID=2077203 RepID=UPI000E2884DD|nr:hypothetical protein [Haloferax sp. Atlit-12N]RDZ65994.1 hypothetical protein C5B90_06515 [Haloferax sp. Atlit-12N]